MRRARKYLSQCLVKLQTSSLQLYSIINIFSTWGSLRMLRGHLQNISDQLSGFLSLKFTPSPYLLSRPHKNTKFPWYFSWKTYLVFPYYIAHSYYMCRNLHIAQSSSPKYCYGSENRLSILGARMPLKCWLCVRVSHVDNLICIFIQVKHD